jgi:TolA-binding protein
MNIEGIGIKPIGGRPIIHRISASWTTEEHGLVVHEAEKFVEEHLATIPPGEAAGALVTSQRALSEAREELRSLGDEEQSVLDDRKAAVMAGNSLAPVEKKLASLQARIAIVRGRVEHLEQISIEMDKAAKKEAREAAQARIEALRVAAEADVKRETENLANLADMLRPLLAAKAKLEALAWQGQRLLSRSV